MGLLKGLREEQRLHGFAFRSAHSGERVIASLNEGKPVIPVWLDVIYQRLRQKLGSSGIFRDQAEIAKPLVDTKIGSDLPSCK